MDTDGSTETSEKMNSSPESKDPEVISKPIEVKERKSNRESKIRKKDDKSVEQVLKALNSLETTEEKLAAMCKKYTDIVDENRKLQLSLKQCEKRCCILQREKEQLQTEHSKAVLSRSRLESLCRELQRQNKAIKEESLLKVREEEEKRKKVSAEFQGTLSEITALTKRNIEKNEKLEQENKAVGQRLDALREKFIVREKEVQNTLLHIKKETELGERKMAMAELAMEMERNDFKEEKRILVMKLNACNQKVSDMQEEEVGLRSQIKLYSEKYDEFKASFMRCDKVIQELKGDVEKNNITIRKLEKETESWKQSFDRCHRALLESQRAKQQRDADVELANRRLTKMLALCHTLQAERSSLLAQVREIGSKKEEEGSDKTNSEEKKEMCESGETEEKIESSPSAEIHEPATEENNVKTEEIKEEEVTTASTLPDKEKEASESLSPPQSEVNECSVDSQEKVVVEDIEYSACSNNDNNKEGKNSLVSDLGIVPPKEIPPASVQITEVMSQEKCEPSFNDSNVKESSSSGNIVQKVEDIEDANLALLRDIEHVKQKLDSCIISNSLPQKEISDEAGCQDNGDKDAGIQELSEEKKSFKDNESDIDVQKTDVSKELEKRCNESKITESCAELGNPSAPTACESNQVMVEPDDHDRSSACEKKQESNNSAVCNIAEKCCSETVHESATKCASENEKEAKEKTLENTCNSNTSAKKETSSLNTKKGKESSRKRKR